MVILYKIKDHDLIVLTETLSKETNSIPGFKPVSTITATPRSNRSCRLSGGISVLFKKEFETFLSTEKQTKNILWCRIDRTILNLTKDLFVCGVYIPPEMSPYFDDEIFEELENDIVNFSKKGNIMLLGDFNARTSNLKDFVSKEGNTFINDIFETSFEQKPEKVLITLLTSMVKVLLKFAKIAT
jgi:hypothetical protein